MKCKHEWKVVYGAYWAVDWIIFKLQHDTYKCKKCGKTKVKRWIDL